MQFRILGLSILCFSFYSCNNNADNFNPQYIGVFSEITELEGVQIFENEFGIATFSLVDSLILLSTAQNEMFKVYDFEENKVASFGSKGSGPGEFLRPPFLYDIYSNNSGNYILVYDGDNLRAVIIDITASIRNSETIVLNEFSLPQKFNHPEVELYFIDSANYLVMYDDRFFQKHDGKRGGWYYSASDDYLIPIPFYNLSIEPSESIPELNLNIRNIGVAPDRTKFVTALMYSPIIEIFQMHSEEPIQYKLEENLPEQPFSLEDFNQGLVAEYIRNVYVTNDRIYLLYVGESVSNPNKGQTMKVINWNGTPVHQYIIPEEFNIDWFQVDESNGTIFGLSWSMDAIYKFDLNR